MRSSLAIAIAAREAGHRHNVLGMLLLQSWIDQTEGNARAENAALLEAIDIGAGQGYMRPFLFFGGGMTARSFRELPERARTPPIFAACWMLIMRQLDDSGSGPSANLLSRRQTEIMRLVAAGYSDRDIAGQLFISERTVKKHLGNTFLWLEASNRTRAVDISRRLNII